MALELLIYTIVIILFIREESEANHIKITLAIDREYSKKAEHAAIYGSSADWNQIMDACSYFWEARSK